MLKSTIICPVCGGPINIQHDDKVNRCEYCANPVLGPSQSRDCVNHPGILAKATCAICGDLICEDCMDRRAGDYGGKLFTVVNCTKRTCVAKSEWARPINEEYEKLINMDWADKSDNFILRVTGLGAVIMMVFELIFILTMLYIQYFTPYGVASSVSFFLFPGDAIIVMGLVVVGMNIVGNLLGAILLQTSLQVHLHSRQLGAGIALMILIIVEALYLLYRGIFFNLSSYPNPPVVQILFSAFLFATILIFVGALMAISNGAKKRKQLKKAREKLGLSM